MSRINTNIQSLIARRSLGVNNSALNEALGRLSTGLRINSGKDDPAGLIASETLRSSMRAISTAMSNATRADTIVAVAEGGLQEISSLLLDLENLIDQSANEAGLTNAEVQANQLQIDSILQSINRIADSAAFGDKQLLNGNLDFTTSGISTTNLDAVQINAAKIPSGASRQVTVNVTTGSTFAQISALLGNADGLNLSAATTVEIRGNLGSEQLSFASGSSAANIATAVNTSTALTGVSAVVSGGGAAGNPSYVFLTSTGYGSDAFVSVDVIENASTFSTSAGNGTQVKGTNGVITINGSSAIVNGLDASVRSGALSLDLILTASFGSTNAGTTSFDITGGGAVFSISPTVGLAGQESIGVSNVTTANLGNRSVGFLSSIKSGQTNDLSSTNFSTAQRIVRKAISEVASLRGRLGGFQKNTLQSTINSLGIALENVSAAESAIRDADFAVETSKLTRAQILVSSSTSILQIANAQPQNALALLG